VNWRHNLCSKQFGSKEQRVAPYGATCGSPPASACSMLVEDSACVCKPSEETGGDPSPGKKQGLPSCGSRCLLLPLRSPNLLPSQPNLILLLGRRRASSSAIWSPATGTQTQSSPHTWLPPPRPSSLAAARDQSRLKPLRTPKHACYLDAEALSPSASGFV
jgi:hypothetical protein